MRHVFSLPALTLLAVPIAAQQGESAPNHAGPAATAAYASYGNSCGTTGYGYGADIIVPAANATTFGGANNNIPFSWSPCRYQQVFDGAETGGAAIVIGLALRQDEQFAQGFDAHTVELEISVGGTTFASGTLTSTFDNNFNSTTSPKTLVYSQRFYALPKMVPVLNSNPATILGNFPFDRPWPKNLGTDNLLVEVRNFQNSNGNALFTYPMDAASGSTTTRLYGLGGPNDATGTLGIGYGHVMFFRTIGATTPPRAILHNANRPVIGTGFHVEMQGFAGGARGALIIGTLQTNIDLTPIGAPACFLLASMNLALPVTMGRGGDLAITIPIPSNPSLDGQNVFLQGAALDPVHALGITFTQGGQLTVGTN